MNYKREELLKLPKRDWNKEAVYDSIALVPTRKKHDSGYHLIAIVGFEKNEPTEIAAYCDDVCYSMPEYYDKPSAYDGKRSYVLRTDMYYPSGITHVWSWYFRFKIGMAVSSTDIDLIPKEEKEGGK